MQQMEELKPFVTQRLGNSLVISICSAVSESLKGNKYQEALLAAPLLSSWYHPIENWDQSWKKLESPIDVAEQISNELLSSNINFKLMSLSNPENLDYKNRKTSPILIGAYFERKLNKKIKHFDMIKTHLESKKLVWKIESIILCKGDICYTAMRKRNEWYLYSIATTLTYENWDDFVLGCFEMDLSLVLVIYKRAKHKIEELKLSDKTNDAIRLMLDKHNRGNNGGKHTNFANYVDWARDVHNAKYVYYAEHVHIGENVNIANSIHIAYNVHIANSVNNIKKLNAENQANIAKRIFSADIWKKKKQKYIAKNSKSQRDSFKPDLKLHISQLEAIEEMIKTEEAKQDREKIPEEYRIDKSTLINWTLPKYNEDEVFTGQNIDEMNPSKLIHRSNRETSEVETKKDRNKTEIETDKSKKKLDPSSEHETTKTSIMPPLDISLTEEIISYYKNKYILSKNIELKQNSTDHSDRMKKIDSKHEEEPKETSRNEIKEKEAPSEADSIESEKNASNKMICNVCSAERVRGTKCAICSDAYISFE